MSAMQNTIDRLMANPTPSNLAVVARMQQRMEKTAYSQYYSIWIDNPALRQEWALFVDDLSNAQSLDEYDQKIKQATFPQPFLRNLPVELSRSNFQQSLIWKQQKEEYQKRDQLGKLIMESDPRMIKTFLADEYKETLTGFKTWNWNGYRLRDGCFRYPLPKGLVIDAAYRYSLSRAGRMGSLFPEQIAFRDGYALYLDGQEVKGTRGIDKYAGNLYSLLCFICPFFN